MKTEFHRKFLKDLASLPAAYRRKVEMLVFETFPDAKHPGEISGLEKMKGYNKYYKIRVGDYRIGVEITGDEMIVQRVMHRKEIYRYFPKD